MNVFDSKKYVQFYTAIVFDSRKYVQFLGEPNRRPKPKFSRIHRIGSELAGMAWP